MAANVARKLATAMMVMGAVLLTAAVAADVEGQTTTTDYCNAVDPLVLGVCVEAAEKNSPGLVEQCCSSLLSSDPEQAAVCPEGLKEKSLREIFTCTMKQIRV